MPARQNSPGSINPSGNRADMASDSLVYADDRKPGISRVRRGKGFSFYMPGGQRITDKAEIVRLAGIVRLLDAAHLRIGNRQYVKDNRSFGVSTLRKRHVSLRGNTIELKYRGKSGKMQQRTIHDRALQRIVRDLLDLSGRPLFQYVDAIGTAHEIGSGDVNRYIADIMGKQFSAKHFRTWGGTLVAFETWLTAREPITLDAVMRKVADDLGNTPTVSRKSYVHPAVIDAIRRKEAFAMPARRARFTPWLQPDERALIAFLRASGPR